MIERETGPPRKAPGFLKTVLKNIRTCYNQLQKNRI